MAKKIDIGFLPMFGFSSKYLFNVIKNVKYEYGIYFTPYDGNYNSIFRFIDIIGHNNVLILCKDIDFIPINYRDVKVTSNTSNFMSLVSQVIDFYDPYAGRHVMSRLYIECFLNNINFKVAVKHNEYPKLNSLIQFKHINYTFDSSFNKIFDTYKVNYCPEYFRTSSYNKYITKCLEDEEFSSYNQFNYVEDLSDDSYKI
jgi:hypothetical protein